MNTLSISSLFSSASRVQVLQTLAQQKTSLGLHQIAALAQCPVQTTQRVLRQLVSEKIVRREKQGNESHYLLCAGHSKSIFLKELVNVALTYNLRHRAASYSQKANSVLQFVDSALSLLQRACAQVQRQTK